MRKCREEGEGIIQQKDRGARNTREAHERGKVKVRVKAKI